MILALQCVVFALAANRVSAADSDSASYTLRPNDTITLSVFDEPDLAANVRILKSGHASFPLIGSVKVGGLSVSSATNKITDLYKKDYLVSPKVTLTVNDYAAEYVSVTGAVNSPGQVPIPTSGLDLSTAIASAGGLAQNANTNKIQLVRASGGTTTFSKAHVDGSHGKTHLSPGDRIVVDSSAFIGKSVSVLGQVKKPGQVPFPVDGKLSLTSAIALAGGLDIYANQKKISVNRKGRIYMLDFKKLSAGGTDDFMLQPDDVVTAAQKWDF